MGDAISYAALTYALAALNSNGGGSGGGEPGRGIDRIELLKSDDLIDTYRVYYTDGSTWDYTIKNGKSPVLGEDYWTESDKQEIINEVLKNIPDGTGLPPITDEDEGKYLKVIDKKAAWGEVNNLIIDGGDLGEI